MNGFVIMCKETSAKAVSSINIYDITADDNEKEAAQNEVIIPNLIGIEEHPEIVDTKQRFGDWEVDTVLDKQGTGAIVSLVERKSKSQGAQEKC
jgi:IS30 family transposase